VFSSFARRGRFYAATNRQHEEMQRRRLMSEIMESKARRPVSERIEKEQLEKDRLEKEQLEKGRLEKERRERQKEEAKRRERERTVHSERIRQPAQKLREDREREKRGKELREQEEWDQAWTKYQSLWAAFRTSCIEVTAGGGNIRDGIPWPVKSGLRGDQTWAWIKRERSKRFNSGYLSS
jgi:septal ring factor EnvC (AmiA/AmiB activator)